MEDLLGPLVNAIVNAAGSAAGNDAYNRICKLISQRLGRFHNRAGLEKRFDATRKRLLANPAAYQLEVNQWLEFLKGIAAEGPTAEKAIHSLQSEIHQSEFTIGKQSAGNVFGPQYNVFVGSKHSGDSDRYGRDILTDENNGTEGADHESQNGHDSSSGAGGFVALVVVLGAILLLIVHSCGGSTPASDPFPNHSDRWPKGLTAAAVMAPIAERLSACAEAPNLSPVNCPQSQSSSDSSGVSDVHWSLHGDPTDGAKIVYLDKQFQVAGNAVMDVTYTNVNGAEYQLDLVNYRAWVNWNNGRPELISITSFVGGKAPIIAKRNPGVAWQQLEGAVQVAFDRCAAAHVAPLPPQCPTESDSTIVGSHARWQLNNDPLLNAQASFNSSWGLINVTGSFSMSATYYVFILGKYHSIETGNYDAVVALDGTAVHVLEITAN